MGCISALRSSNHLVPWRFRTPFHENQGPSCSKPTREVEGYSDAGNAGAGERGVKTGMIDEEESHTRLVP